MNPAPIAWALAVGAWGLSAREERRAAREDRVFRAGWAMVCVALLAFAFAVGSPK